ncbi:hypothetical protein E5843_12970 [Luteimonas yindakuii]|uniref:hypothetical protein n=1 Tax=Luteimonas yindakuii TaxID=2565782 RepID=UPI0010A40E6D|nr:hypothetical protein [Luteimonas yindakuii]QCO68451.1 hypothetical protein E5843_12970 [Luteimonas yindakuii]
MRGFVLISALLASSSVAAQSCYEDSIISPSPFMGNDGEVFKLSDGTLWEVKYEYEYLYEYYPTVIICPSLGKLGIDGKMLSVEAIGTAATQSASSLSNDGIVESKIDGEFNGWEGETIFKLRNGQIWQQIDGRYKYKYKYSPAVLLIPRGNHHEMRVEGMDVAVRVVRLK